MKEEQQVAIATILLMQKRHIEEQSQMIVCMVLGIGAVVLWVGVPRTIRDGYSWLDVPVFLLWIFCVRLNWKLFRKSRQKLARVDSALKDLRKYQQTHQCSFEQLEAIVNEAVTP